MNKAYLLFIVCLSIGDVNAQSRAGITGKAIAQPVKNSFSFIVAQDGSSRYKTIQSVFDAIPFKNKKPVTVFIKNGIYKEKLHLDSSKNFVTLIGEDKFNTVFT